VAEIRDEWAAGSTYEAFMGRWSRELAPRFVSWLAIPAHVHWLDVGCGTGALTSAICSHANPASVLGCDPAEPLITYAQRHCEDTRASFATAGAGVLPDRAGGYGSISSLLALNFFPDPAAAIHEMQSLAAAEGTISACVWDYETGLEFLRYFWDAAASVDPSARDLDEGRRFPLCHPDALVGLFNSAGLGRVCCTPICIATEFASFGDYWQPFLGGTGPAPTYVASLDADRRSTLARELEQVLPTTPGGAIVLDARAWAIKGTVT